MIKKLIGLRLSRSYISLLGLFAATYIWRATTALWFAPISDHISNFAITGGAILLLIGPKDFEKKSAWNKVLQITCTFALANIILESLNVGDLNLPGLTFLAFNTADAFDMVYGLAAVMLVAFVYWKRAR